MNTDNPFPGMNPYFEGFWPDVHTTLIGGPPLPAAEENWVMERLREAGLR